MWRQVILPWLFLPPDLDKLTNKLFSGVDVVISPNVEFVIALRLGDVGL